MSNQNNQTGTDQAADTAAEKAAEKPAEKSGGSKSAAEKAPPLKPWQEESWTGPLTADQAAWRRAHIKPVEKVRTK